MSFVTKNSLAPRPNASNGIWVMFLLPSAIILSSLKHGIVLNQTYKLITITSIGLLLSAFNVSAKIIQNKHFTFLNTATLLVGCVETFLFYTFSPNQDNWFFAITSTMFVLSFQRLFIFLLQTFRYNLTLGEAGLVAQAIIMVVYSIFLHGFETKFSSTNMKISTLILQLGLLGIVSVSWITCKFKILTPVKFYLTAGFVIFAGSLLPLHIFMKQSPILWILHQIVYDISTLKLFIYWSFCSGIAVLAVSNQIFYAQKASTSRRKVFHILSVVVFLPGLFHRCSILYLSTGVVLGIFFALELLRILRMPPLGRQLQDGYIVFSDEKDTGVLALTPIYLLVGCSIPLWVHPSPCDVTDSGMFNILPLLSGVLTIGVGDTAASVIGSKIGRIKWPGSQKTFEGTIACILSQLAFVYLLVYIGAIPHLKQSEISKFCIAVLVTSIVEANTKQIDNLVLPFLMYLITI